MDWEVDEEGRREIEREEIEREEMGKGGRRDGRGGEEGLVVVIGVFEAGEIHK